MAVGLWDIENEAIGGSWGKLLQNSQMGFGIVTATEASDDEGLGVGQALDDAPRIELVVVGHGETETIATGTIALGLQAEQLDQSGSGGLRSAKITRRLTGAKCL